ncbi:MAG: hypothetical protein C0399_13185, partial [Syntrophus sp. (in: bacteria)]|nr:hypothetical protein [Syntrophus sp. (in: bacteria)]
ISMKSSVDGTAQLYYDIGNGLSEENSVMESVIGDQQYHDYQFRLPRQSVYGMRFDPLMSVGSVAIKHVQWMDGLGAVIQIINLKQLQPLNQIGSFTFTGHAVEVVTHQNVNDPQVGVLLNRPLTAGRSFFFWRHPTVILKILVESVAVFFIIIVLWSFWFNWRKIVALLLHGGKIPFAMLLAFIAVITIEIIQQAKLPATAFYHEVDSRLYHLQTHRINADYLLLGDSVGGQLFRNTPHLQNEKYAILATNQAVTMTGQYFIAKRYLQRNQMPRAVILLTSTYFHSHLEHNLSDNYVQRTFTDFSEIFEIFLLMRDPAFTVKMLAYRLLPSFKYRLFLQKRWAGFTNAETYTGVAYDNKESGNTRYSLLRTLRSYIAIKNIPTHHFKSLLAMLDLSHIPLYFLVPAINEHRMIRHEEYRNLRGGLFPELQKTYSNFHFDNDSHILQTKYYFDGSHFNDEGLKIETQRLHEKVIYIEQLINQEAIDANKR